MGVGPNWKKMVKDPEMVRRLTDRTFELYAKEAADKGEVVVREGVIEVVDKVKQLGWMTALATGSNWAAVETELEQLGLYLAFDMTTTGEEVLFQKPDPEIYVLSAQKLGTDFSECLVIEDSVSGVEAGNAAGMIVVGLVTEYSSETKLKAAGANYVIKEFRELIDILDELKEKEHINTSEEEG
jgi:beta-phosphoglucomutase